VLTFHERGIHLDRALDRQHRADPSIEGGIIFEHGDCFDDSIECRLIRNQHCPTRVDGVQEARMLARRVPRLCTPGPSMHYDSEHEGDYYGPRFALQHERDWCKGKPTLSEGRPAMKFHEVDVAKVFKRMRELAPEAYRSWLEFDHKAFADGALPVKTKELIALGIAHITQCPWCIDAHVKKAVAAGATDQELGEVIFVAMAMAAGAAWSHGGLALQCLDNHRSGA